MGVEDGELFLGELSDEPGGSADAVAACSWVDRDLEGGWPAWFVNARCLV